MIWIKRVLVGLISILALGYLGLMGMAFALQRSVLFPAPRSPLQEPPQQARLPEALTAGRASGGRAAPAGRAGHADDGALPRQRGADLPT